MDTGNFSRGDSSLTCRSGWGAREDSYPAAKACHPSLGDCLGSSCGFVNLAIRIAVPSSFLDGLALLLGLDRLIDIFGQPSASPARWARRPLSDQTLNLKDYDPFF